MTSDSNATPDAVLAARTAAAAIHDKKGEDIVLLDLSGLLVVTDVFVVSRTALRSDNQVWTVDEEDRLQPRFVEVLRLDREIVVIGRGIAPGERICISAIDTPVFGMKVRIAESSMIPKAEPPLMEGRL